MKRRGKALTEKARAATKALIPRAEREHGSLAYAARLLKGGKEALIDLARCSADEKVQAVVAEWDGFSSHQKRHHQLEPLCEGHSLSAGEFLGRVAQAAHDTGLDISRLIAGLEHPRVVQKSIQMAMRQNGFKDREMILKHSGFLPTPAGPRINVNASATAQNANVIVPEQTQGLPSFENQMVRTLNAVRGTE